MGGGLTVAEYRSPRVARSRGDLGGVGGDLGTGVGVVATFETAMDMADEGLSRLPWVERVDATKASANVRLVSRTGGASRWHLGNGGRWP